MSMNFPASHIPKAVLFDMDGTLTVPTFDFPAVRRAIGLPEGAPILEHVALLPEAQRLSAEIILRQFEDEVADKAPLAQGCHDVLQYLIGRDIKLALITRNRRDSVTTFFKRYPLPIEIWITRDDAPHKPDPAPLLMACKKLGVEPGDCWMVGDGVYDIEAGINAGMRTVWLSWKRERYFAAAPWHEVEDLCGLHDFLRQLD